MSQHLPFGVVEVETFGSGLYYCFDRKGMGRRCRLDSVKKSSNGRSALGPSFLLLVVARVEDDFEGV